MGESGAGAKIRAGSWVFFFFNSPDTHVQYVDVICICQVYQICQRLQEEEEEEEEDVLQET